MPYEAGGGTKVVTRRVAINKPAIVRKPIPVPRASGHPTQRRVVVPRRIVPKKVMPKKVVKRTRVSARPVIRSSSGGTVSRSSSGGVTTSSSIFPSQKDLNDRARAAVDAELG